MDTAVELIAQRKHSDFTLRELAKHLDVTHAATYHHFRDKEDLLAVVAQQGYASLNAQLKDALTRQVHGASECNAILKLHAVGIAYLRFALENQAHFRVMFGRKFGDLSLFPEIHQVSQTSRDLLLSILQQAQQEGYYVDADLSELLALQWASLHGLALLTINGHFDHLDPETSLQSFFTRVLQHLLCGVATPDGAALFQRIGHEEVGCSE